MSSRASAVAKLVGVDLFGSLLWFPVWWYSTGLKRVALGVHSDLTYRWQEYGFAIWLKNFFVPMYGQYDIAGRLVSVFMRFVVLVGRAIAFVVEALFYAVGICLWVIAPIIFATMIILNTVKGIR